MHKTNPDGTLLGSFCDYCQREWIPEGNEIMIEGHQGSLICLKCLSTAYTDIVFAGGGFENQHKVCTMCLEERDQPEWESPLSDPDKPARVCLRCIKQAATALEKDPETGWKRPGKA